jgi:hypothetical protein
MEPVDQLTEEEEARVALLGPRELERIDESLMSHAIQSWRKVAMIVALAMDDTRSQIQHVPDVFYSRRVAFLVSEGKLEAFGDLRRMRYSEVRLAQTH